jgi:hypothetical protein
MNLEATIGSVKALSDDDRAKHLQAIDAHRKAIARHTAGIQAHLKSMLDFDDADDTDNEPVIEGEDEDDDDKAFLVELRKLAEQAEALTTT